MNDNRADLRIAIIIGSSRPGRRADQVAQWVLGLARDHAPSVHFELVDVAEAQLPLLDEPVPAAIGNYRNTHTLRWASTVASFDGFVFVTPEYNHSMPAALKNAVDFLFAEWNDKAAGFVSYGLNGGTRAVEHLRGVLAEVKVACVRSQVTLSLFTDFTISDMTEPGTFTPAAHHSDLLARMIDDVVDWAGALRGLRTADTQLPFTVLIEFDVPPDHQQDLVTMLAEQIDQSLPGVPGFRSAKVQASLDGHTVINYAQWATRRAWEEATGLDATSTGGQTDQPWAENQGDSWFGRDVDRNPVAVILERVGGATRRVTAFDESRLISAEA